jgi:inosose dehydratase
MPMDSVSTPRSTTPSAGRPPVRDRVAGAPISWGVCEVPGWGFQLTPDVVLTQMRDVGLAATEFGPDGFLPDAPADKAATLSRYALAAVGQFVPAVLHDPDHDPLPAVQQAMAALGAAHASTVVIAAATGAEGYDTRPTLDDAGWTTLLANLDRIDEAARASGLLATLHPHVGTMIESGEQTQRVIDGCAIALCLDTGHLLIGGGDPVAVATAHPERIGHVHLKDVRLPWAERVRNGQVSYTEAVAGGIYAPLGDGDVDVAAIVIALEGNGYSGWYVLEQDTILTADPATDPAGSGPLADITASIAHIIAVAESLPLQAIPDV